MKKITPILAMFVMFSVFTNTDLARAAIKYINGTDGGDCSLIGTWEPTNNTCTLKGHLTDTIYIMSDNVTLDGNGFTLTGGGGPSFPSGEGSGVYLEARTGVTIRNLVVTRFLDGISVLRSSNNTLMGNTLTGNLSVGINVSEFSDNNNLVNNVMNTTGDGIIVNKSSGNTIRGNVGTANIYSGIILDTNSNNNAVIENTIYSNNFGISISASNNNTITGNSVTDNIYNGISIYWSASINNIVTKNSISGNGVSVPNGAGILLLDAGNNQIYYNDILNNSRGISLAGNSAGNRIYNNNFITNTTQALSTPANLFDLGLPTGGNYWDNWTTPDLNNDRFVDSPYLFVNGGKDNYPWTMRDGWVSPPDTNPPEITIYSPLQDNYYIHSDMLFIHFAAEDSSGLATGSPSATFDSIPVSNDQQINLFTLSVGAHTLTVTATDTAGNSSSKSVSFEIYATIDSLMAYVDYFRQNGMINDGNFFKALQNTLREAKEAQLRGNLKTERNKLNDFIDKVKAQTDKNILSNAANMIIADTQYVLSGL